MPPKLERLTQGSEKSDVWKDGFDPDWGLIRRIFGEINMFLWKYFKSIYQAWKSKITIKHIKGALNSTIRCELVMVVLIVVNRDILWNQFISLGTNFREFR